jgi:hypothetical protein
MVYHNLKRKLQAGELVRLDVGCNYEMYKVDFGLAVLPERLIAARACHKDFLMFETGFFQDVLTSIRRALF